jgi:hypothetical protein
VLLVSKNWLEKCSFRTKLRPIFLNTNNGTKTPNVSLSLPFE